MHFKDQNIITGYGRLTILIKKNGRLIDIYDVGENAIHWRMKYVLSRLLGGGNTTQDSFRFFGELLRVTGIALGNGGHLIYRSTDKKNDVTVVTDPSNSILQSNSLVIDNTKVTHDFSRPAMPYIPSDDNFGYSGITNNPFPGTIYESVFNGNVPWDGITAAQQWDNGYNDTTESVEPGITLFSETYRIPLDPIDFSSANSGISFTSKYEVTFKATLNSNELNFNGNWGYANAPANIITEAGLVTGFIPTRNQNGLVNNFPYSNDGLSPSNNNNLKNNTSKYQGLFQGLDTYPLKNLIPDSLLPNKSNKWNLITRKTFGGITKNLGLSFVFIWTIGF